MRLKIDFLKQEEKFFLGLVEIIFRFTFITFLVLFILDYLVRGFVTNWFNPIWFLIIALISGIITALKN